MIGVFIDTFVVLTMTALVVISTLFVNGPLAGADGNTYAGLLEASGITKTNAMQTAASSVFGNFGSIFVAICLLFFAFSTVISWNFFGKINVQYLFGKKAKIAVVIYSVISIAFIFLGSLLQNDLVWELTDFFNYLMVIPNAIALIALSNLVVKTSKEGIAAKKAAKEDK
jgi:AGCS family alanine or glycine:cation symporter